MRHRTPSRSPLTALLGCVLLLGVAAAGPATGCKKKKALSQAQICRKGCEFRLACIEEMALDKAVTDANREVVKQTQSKNHQQFLDYCVGKCDGADARFRAYGACGAKANNCRDYFACESQAIKDLTQGMK